MKKSVFRNFTGIQRQKFDHRSALVGYKRLVTDPVNRLGCDLQTINALQRSRAMGLMASNAAGNQRIKMLLGRLLLDQLMG